MPRSNERRSITRKQFLDEVRSCAERIGVKPTRVQVQRLTSKWASCSAERRLTFGGDLLHEPLRFREEVIVHELLHLLVPTHGKLFRVLMRAELRRDEHRAMRCRFEERAERV